MNHDGRSGGGPNALKPRFHASAEAGRISLLQVTGGRTAHARHPGPDGCGTEQTAPKVADGNPRDQRIPDALRTVPGQAIAQMVRELRDVCREQGHLASTIDADTWECRRCGGVWPD